MDSISKLCLYDTPNTLIPLENFTKAFTQLELQGNEILGSNATPSVAPRRIGESEEYYGCLSPLPLPCPCFETIDDAWIAFHRHWHALNAWAADFSQTDCSAVEATVLKPGRDCQILSQDLALWKFGFEKMKENCEPFSLRDTCICALLECHLLSATEMLRTAGIEGEAHWDDRREEFQQIVRLCRAMVSIEPQVGLDQLTTHYRGATSKGLSDIEMGFSDSTQSIVRQQRSVPTVGQERSEGGGSKFMTIDMGIVPILFKVIHKSRDARIRMDAINLLENYPRTEGLWDGRLVAQVGRIIDRVERLDSSLEDAAAESLGADVVPSWTRILRVQIEFSSEDRVAWVICTRARNKNDHRLRHLRERVTW